MRSLDPRDIPSPPRPMTTAIIGGLLFIGLNVFLSASGWINSRMGRKIQPLAPTTAPLRLGEIPHPFHITNADGVTLTSTTSQGKWTVLLLLDESCPACAGDAYEWEQLSAQWKHQFRLVGLVKVGWWHAAQRTEAFRRTSKVSFPCWPDVNGHVGRRLAGIRVVHPTEMLFDPKGRLAMFDDGSLVSGNYLSPYDRWNEILKVFIRGVPVPSPSHPYELPAQLLALRINMGSNRTVRLGDLCDRYQALVVTMIGSGCFACNDRLSYLTRLPAVGVGHLVLSRDDSPAILNESHEGFESLGAVLGTTNYTPILETLGFEGTPDTLLITHGNLIGRIQQKDRVPPMLLAVLNQVRPDITQFARQSGAHLSPNGPGTQGSTLVAHDTTR